MIIENRETGTYTVPQAAYNQLVRERDELRESYRIVLELNTEMAMNLKRLQAEAWEEGWRTATDHPNAGRNPYREA